jgi:hypothetical protein
METVRSLPFLCVAAVCFAFGQTQALAYTDFGQGRPIAAKDLAGKKFCWDQGGWAIYAADGHYTNNKGIHTHSFVPEPGVVEIGYARVQSEALADGRVHNHRFCGTCQYHDKDFWGTLCN